MNALIFFAQNVLSKSLKIVVAIDIRAFMVTFMFLIAVHFNFFAARPHFLFSFLIESPFCVVCARPAEKFGRERKLCTH